MIQQHRGFTLIELLVVIAIIAVLVGLLLPAVQKVREAANRMACTNNLKNLGLALVHFENTHRKFPPGQVMGPLPEAGVPNPVNHGWGPFLLPFIELQPLFDRYRWDLKGTDPVNRPVGATQLTIFQCPSAPEPNRYYTAGPSGMGACGDYAPTWYVDASLVEKGLIDPLGNYQGVLQPNHMTRRCEITDGTSHTILLGEDAGRPKRWRAGRPGPDQVVEGGPWAAVNNGIMLQGSTPDGTERPGSCALNCTNERQVYSFHAAGANAVFADGSVHFLKADINIRILAALVTRAGGEIVSAADY
jgi:prepilin-type N-terminal cleavage/methylation domain-containing protein/prepilin-type processing-associated H-X9-DG protein